MKKFIKNALIKKSYMSFLEVVQQDSCDCRGTVSILMKEQPTDELPYLEPITRYVKVCDSSKKCQIYAIPIDENTGIGELQIKNIEGVQVSLVEVDKEGQQLVNTNDFHISYYVDHEETGMDCAQVVFDHTSKMVEIEIIHQKLEECSLMIKKMIENEDGSLVPIQDKQTYRFLLEDQNGEQFCEILNCENNYETMIEHLFKQRYEIKEDISDYYLLNGQQIQGTMIDLNQKENVLECVVSKDCPTELVIEKWIRNQKGALHRPSEGAEYPIQVLSNTLEEMVQLNQENQYVVCMTKLDAGSYDVKEIQADGKKIYYSVNGEEETTYAHIDLHPHERAYVMVIEEECMEESCITTNTLLRICKYMKHYDGCIDKPNRQENFKIMLIGCGQRNTFYLNANNNYCVEIADLCEGTYEVVECDCDEYITTYCINGGMETTTAQICIMKGIYNCVSIINEEKNKGSVNIYKYIRNEHHELVKPNDDDYFFGCLSSCFGKQEFTLCKENDWCIGFENLRYGSYEVRENDTNDYYVRYQVNNQKEESYARFVVDHECEQDVKIINCVQDCLNGTLKICKYIETAHHQIAKPQTDEIFEISVDGPCFHNTYTLCSANHWCIVLDGLRQGEYQVCECEHKQYEVRYFVNRTPSVDGYVYVGENTQEVCILNRQKRCGNVKLYKVIRDCDGTMHLPSYNESFEILMESDDTCIKTTLDYQNGWCVVLNDLSYGNYQVIEKDALGYRVSYCVDGTEKQNAKFYLGTQDINIGIINENCATAGNVRICGSCEEESSDCLNDPISFTLYGRGIEQTYELNQQNQYRICFDDLEEGNYRIVAENVKYVICGHEQKDGYFVLGEDDVNIRLVYMKECSQNIYIEKLIMRDGEYEKPRDEDSYRVLMKGKHIHQIYELNKYNDFAICLKDMPYQHYEVSELGCLCKHYCINGNLQNNGYFLYQGDQVHIQIMNEPCQKGCVQITKVIEDQDGIRHHPQRWECFEIMIENDDYRQVFRLSHENDFTLHLCDIPYGTYCIYEKNVKDVKYEIQGEYQTCGKFCVGDEDVVIIVINSVGCKGCLQLEGYNEIENEIVHPNPCEKFCMIVENEMDEYEIELNYENDFYDCLCMLPKGIYTIHANQDEDYDFIVDDQCFHNEAIIGICDETAYVKVIKKKQEATVYIDAMLQNQNGDDCCIPENCTIDIEVIGNQGKEWYCLNQENDWKIQLCLPYGRYQIQQSSLEGFQEPYYLVNGVKTKDVDLEICKCDQFITCVNCYEQKNGSICILKQIRDEQGNFEKPKENEQFQVILSGDGDCKKIVLNKENDWSYTVCNLEDGRYQIQEQGNCHHVSYIVNEQGETDYAEVYMHQNHQQVRIINDRKEPLGSIEITKLIKDEEGCYCTPGDDQQYWVQVIGNGFYKRLCLNKENHFYACIRCLKNDTYEIFEENGKDVMYIVNNDAPSTKAIVHVCNHVNTVNIVNREKDAKGSIYVSKYIQNDGVCMKPISGTYSIQITGNQQCTQYELNKDNHYCVGIHDLECGMYEIEEMNHENVVYSVDCGLPSEHAYVQVQCDCHDVQVINRNSSCGKITLIKYIRENGQLKKPKKGVYTFRVTKPGYHNIVVLSDENHWTMTLDHLSDGVYTITETSSSYNVSYIVNEESETTLGVVRVKGNENIVKIINEPKDENGQIIIEKYIRKDGTLVKPEMNYEAVIRLSGAEYEQEFKLNKENQWKVNVSGLEYGMYEVEELNGLNVHYSINGGKETTRGVLCVCSEGNFVSVINEDEDKKGSIKIKKYVRYGETGDLETPADDFYVRLLITKPRYRKYVTLDVENDFSTTLEQLEDGLYVIQEIEPKHEVSYRINGQAEVANATIRVEQNENTVQVIDTLSITQGSIYLRKVIENEQGEQVLPQEKERFNVSIRGNDYHKDIVLAKDNQWTMLLEDLDDGMYEIQESAQQTYDVSYCVDGKCKEDAKVFVKGTEHEVVIVNKKKEVGATLQLTKFIKQANGTLVRPADGDDFTIEIINESYQKRVSLNGSNAFTKVIFDLPEGIYRIREINQDNYTVTYRLNGGEVVNDLDVTITPETKANVDIINERTINRNVIDVFKYMLDANEEYVPPKENETFAFEIIGNQGKETYELNKENEWHVTLKDYPSGKYQIVETTSQYDVQYLVNSPTLMQDAYFEASAQKTNIIGIINKLPNVENGSLLITKRIKTLQGNLIVPNDGDYVIKITRNKEETYEILNQENEYEKVVKNLSYGEYRIEEVSSTMEVYYIVDGKEVEDMAVVNITDENQHNIIIVNVEKQSQNDIKIII